MNFTDLFIKRPILSVVVSLLILLVGMRSLVSLPLRQYPLLTNTTISITTAYPGATADLIQGFISTPIEQAIASVDGLDYVTSVSTQSTSTVTAFIKLNRDPNAAMTDVMAKVQQVKFQIPKEANDPIIVKSTGDQFGVMYIAIDSPSLSGPAISDYVNRVVKPIMATVDGVADVQVFGAQTLAMRLWMDPERMAARNVSADDVANAIRANNFQTAPGQAKGLFVITNVEANTDLTDVQKFKDMVVKSADGAQVRLSDIALVQLGGQDYSTAAAIDGRTAVVVGIMPAPSGNPLDITKQIRKLFPDLEKSMPPSMSMSIVWDSSEFIRSAISEVIWTLGEAVVIVIVVIFLFLGSVRSVAIPVVTIPLSLVGVATLMLALGFSLNLLTLLALVLAIGLVVDDAIVVVENVYRHIEEGHKPVEAALMGAREIVGPVIAMTITLAAVYAPIGFLSGLTGALFREFAFTLAGAVVISGIVALTLSPMMASVLLNTHLHEGGFAQRVDRAFTRLTAWYTRKLTSVLEYRAAMTVFVVGVFVSVAFLYTHSRTELAPQEDQGVMMGILKAPQTANLDYTNAYALKLGAILNKYPEVESSFTFSGMQGPQMAMSAMQLKPWSERKRLVPALMQDLQKEMGALDGVNGFAFTIPPLPGSFGTLPVSFVISSPDNYKSVFDQMETIKANAQKSGRFIVVDSDLTYNNPIIKLDIDRNKAHDLGLSMQTIGSTLATLVGGNYINRFNMEGRAYQVVTQVPRSDRLTAQALTQYFVKTASGEQVPLSSVVTVKNTVEPNALSRYNQLNSATFSAVPMPGVSMGEAVQFLREQAEQLPTNFQTAFLSDSRQFVTEGNQLTYTFAFALIVIYLILAAQFESLRDPLVILITVPLSIMGALLPLFFGLSTINIYTQVGLVTLIGLISKHGILMLSFARDMQVREGADKHDAIIEAARVRLRPILMTTAAMVAGLLPLLFASGAGAGARFAIGIVVVSGMAIGTMFTLFVLPSVYLWLATDHRAVVRAGRLRPAPAE